MPAANPPRRGDEIFRPACNVRRRCSLFRHSNCAKVPSSQQEAGMAKEATGHFEIPREMRAFAEQSVEQARKAFDGFMTAAQNGAKDVRQKAMGFAEKNVAMSFEFAQKLVHARDIEEVTRLQTEFVQRQMQALAEQAQELAQTATRAMGAARPSS